MSCAPMCYARWRVDPQREWSLLEDTGMARFEVALEGAADLHDLKAIPH